MSAEKPRKTKIARRKPGLVITPPVARPVQDNHPARLIFQEAIAAEKAASDHGDASSGNQLGPPSNVQPDMDLHTAVTHPSESLRVKGVAVRPGDNISRASVVEGLDSQPINSEVSGPGADIESNGVINLKLPGAAIQEDEYAKVSANEQRSPRIEHLSWEEFERTFKKRLSKSQLKVCKILFEKTYALGLESCLIRTYDLMELSHVMGRTIYYALSELENAGFITRGMIYNTPTKKGQVISFHPIPKIRREEGDRSFHYHDQFD